MHLLYTRLAIPLLFLSLGCAQAQTPPPAPAPDSVVLESTNTADSPEAGFLRAANDHCLTPLLGDGDIAAHAIKNNLPEFSSMDAADLDTNGGRAFGLPPYAQDQAVIVRPGVGCSVVMRYADFATMVTAADDYFTVASPYRLLDEQFTDQGSIARVYGAEMGGPLTLYLNIHATAPAQGGAQTIITIVRRPSTAAQ